jgi:release factor glutamine methyltransferase
MLPSNVFRLFYQNGIPLADIRIVFDGYFKIPFDTAETSEREISDAEAEAVLRKLKAGYPAAYLAGYVDVLGNRLFLTPAVLIPRTETIDFLSALDLAAVPHSRILDLGTGSGLIALSLKRRYPEAEVFASDISEEALALAEKSADFNHLAVHFLRSDFWKDIPGTFDLVISNPPYIEEGNPETEAPFEPPLALYSGKDGLDSYRAIFAGLSSHLNPKGRGVFELESSNAEKTEELFFRLNPLGYTAERIPDMEGKDRYLWVFRN